MIRSNRKRARRSIGRTIRGLGFQPRRMTGGASGWVYDAERVKRLGERYDTPPQDTFTNLTNFTNLTGEAVLNILQRANPIRIHNLQGALTDRSYSIEALNDILAALEGQNLIINNTDRGLISLRRSQQ